jgi:Tol biopolymer transport system component
MRIVTFLAILGGFALPVAANASSCNFKPSTAPLPQLTGRLVYQSVNPTTGNSRNIYLYDFTQPSVAPKAIVRAAWHLNQPLNPVFSPDGKGVLFSALNNGAGARDLYYWAVGSSGAPVKLTNATTATQPEEDAKFSADGKRVVWKHDYNIVVASIQFDSGGRPSLSTPAYLVNGVQSSPSEPSGPVFSPLGNYIYFFTGSTRAGFIEQLARYNFSTQAIENPFSTPQDKTLQYYYPADPDSYDFIYVRWDSADSKTGQHDKIFRYSSISNSTNEWNANDCTAENADPAVVNDDLFVYSRKNSGKYRLILGQFSTGLSWELGNLKGDLQGANYTNERN